MYYMTTIGKDRLSKLAIGAKEQSENVDDKPENVDNKLQNVSLPIQIAVSYSLFLAFLAFLFVVLHS